VGGMNEEKCLVVAAGMMRLMLGLGRGRGKGGRME